MTKRTNWPEGATRNRDTRRPGRSATDTSRAAMLLPGEVPRRKQMESPSSSVKLTSVPLSPCTLLAPCDARRSASQCSGCKPGVSHARCDRAQPARPRSGARATTGAAAAAAASSAVAMPTNSSRSFAATSLISTSRRLRLHRPSAEADSTTPKAQTQPRRPPPFAEADGCTASLKLRGSSSRSDAWATSNGLGDALPKEEVICGWLMEKHRWCLAKRLMPGPSKSCNTASATPVAASCTSAGEWLSTRSTCSRPGLNQSPRTSCILRSKRPRAKPAAE
mmetsp:Transcript_47138/g.90960  ORF Transcript_47138/g.90960 Transcript_47138/m.90960 type:complete len:279 (+) Transcript_47138:77-913(+)